MKTPRARVRPAAPRTAEHFATDHKVLLDAARLQSYLEFTRTCQRWVNIVDPDGAEQKAAAQRAAREVDRLRYRQRQTRRRTGHNPDDDPDQRPVMGIRPPGPIRATTGYDWTNGLR